MQSARIWLRLCARRFRVLKHLVKESGLPSEDRSHALALRKVQKKALSPELVHLRAKACMEARQEALRCNRSQSGARTMPKWCARKKGDLEVALGMEFDCPAAGQAAALCLLGAASELQCIPAAMAEV